jgi:hypothetical protein
MSMARDIEAAERFLDLLTESGHRELTPDEHAEQVAYHAAWQRKARMQAVSDFQTARQRHRQAVQHHQSALQLWQTVNRQFGAASRASVVSPRGFLAFEIMEGTATDLVALTGLYADLAKSQRSEAFAISHRPIWSAGASWIGTEDDKREAELVREGFFRDLTPAENEERQEQRDRHHARQLAAAVEAQKVIGDLHKRAIKVHADAEGWWRQLISSLPPTSPSRAWTEQIMALAAAVADSQRAWKQSAGTIVRRLTAPCT